MRSPDQSELDQYIYLVLEKKFGFLLNWQAPKVEKTVGPYQPEVFSKYANKRDALVNEARSVLSNYSDQLLLVLYDKTIPDPEDITTGWNDFLRDEIDRLKHFRPSWFWGGFGHPDYAADFEYWGQMESYSLFEALILSIGVEPKHFKEPWLWDAKKQMEREKLIAPVEFLVRRHEQFLRKYPRGPSGPAHASPGFLWNWFEDVGMAIHSDFRDALQRRVRRHETNADSVKKTAATDLPADKPDPREIDKIAQLFTAMAIDQLGYQPHAARSPVPKEIADLAASMGLSISDDTVRKYLRRGAAFIPEGWKPE